MQNKNKLNWRFFLYSRKYLTISVGLFITAGALFMFGAYPQIDVALSNNKKLKIEQTKLKKIQKKSLELEQIRLLPEFQERETVDQVLPSRKPLLELLSALGSLSNSNSVVVGNFSIKPGDIASDSTQLKTQRTSSAKFQKMDSSLTVSGRIEDVENFITTLETIPPITTITNIDLTRTRKENPDGTETINAEADLQIETFFFTQTISSAVTQELPKIGEKEKEIFNTIKEFTPTNFKEQTTIESGHLEDIFNIEGLDVGTYEALIEETTQTKPSESAF